MQIHADGLQQMVFVFFSFFFIIIIFRIAKHQNQKCLNFQLTCIMKIGKILNLKKPFSKVKTVKFLILVQIIPNYVTFLQRLCKYIYSNFNHNKYGQDLCLDLLQLSVRRFAYRFGSRKQHKQTAGCMTL